MSITKAEIEQNFNKTNVLRHDIGQTSKSIQQYLQYMDYKIRKQFRSFTLLSLCGAQRGNFTVEQSFQKAFASLNLQQKTNYYSKYVENLYKLSQKLKKKDKKTQQQQPQKIKSYNEIIIPLKVGKGFGDFEKTQIQIKNFRVKSNGKSQFDINLRNYLLRKSKKKNPTYVLEAIKYSDPQTIRFAFITTEDENKYLPIIIQCIEDACYENIALQMDQYQSRKTLNPNLRVNQVTLKKDNNQMRFLDEIPKSQSQFLNLENNGMRQSRLNKSVIQDIVKSREEQQLDNDLTEFIDQQNDELAELEIQKRKSKQSINTPTFQPNNRNIFKIILPSFQLNEMKTLHHYGSVYQSKLSQLYVYQNMKKSSQFKMQMSVALPIHIVCKAICNVQLFKHWHPIIDQGQIKLKISSENSCIMYLKTKAFSQWYRDRDYLILAHLFRFNNAYYIVQKSIQHSNFVPFQSITRGKIQHCVWKIQSENDHSKSEPKCRIVVDFDVDHGGLLNKNHQKQLSLRFLKGFQFMEAYYRQIEHQKKLTQIFGFNWVISDRQLETQDQNKFMRSNTLKSCDFNNHSQISESDQQVFYSIEDLSEEQKQLQLAQQKQQSQHEIEPQKADKVMMMNSQIIGNKQQEQNILLDEEGLVILPKKYLKKKHIMQPFETQKKLMQFSYESIVEKDHWILEKGGGLKLINKVKIQAQNNVIKFIMKTLKKNLLSGKGVTGISLPVQIFNVDSNLQRCCLAMSLGPQFLQEVAKSQDYLERFKKVMAFGLSNSIIYFDVEKPFNPILGQTYQGFIRGCPIYGEQISHHPPISTIYFVGRGYKVTANLQAKVYVHMNSGDGINEGFYHVIFDDKHEILFQTPPAEISGLAFGDRRFAMKNKGLYIDQKNHLFCQMKFEASGGLWSKKKRDFSDQIDGQIVKVKPDFIRKFMAAPMDKKPSPTQGDIVQTLGQLSGRWPLQLNINGKPYYKIRQDIPDKLVDDIYPLNSNSNYREDLLYRKKNDLVRSQIEKQRLQILQRGDRKFRQKFHGKQQH